MITVGVLKVFESASIVLSKGPDPHSSDAHMSCIIFSAASNTVFEGIFLLLTVCLGFLLVKCSMQSFLLPPVRALGM